MARYYKVDGKRFPSVTTALSIIRKPQLEVWRGDHGNAEADRLMYEAAELGSLVHDLCHVINTGQDLDAVPEGLSGIIQAYRDWLKAAVKEIVRAEDILVSRRYEYAGRCDLIAIMKGDRTHPSIIDIKTSKIIYPDTALQLAGYQQAATEMELRPNRRLILQLDKITYGKFKVVEYRDHQEDLRMFLYALELWRYFNKGEIK